MKRNWIVFAFALLALASCSVEKRVYQPGYHIEWNHFAKQDAEQGRSEGASQDLFQDAVQGRSEGASQDLPQDLSKNLSENLENDASQDLFQDAVQGRSEGASQDLPQDLSKNLSKNLETDVSQGLSKNLETDVSQGLSKNLETDVSQDLPQKINSDLEFVLLIILALFLPALTIFLLEGFSKNFWIALLLMICSFSLPFLAVVVRAILETIAIIVAIAVVLHYV